MGTNRHGIGTPARRRPAAAAAAAEVAGDPLARPSRRRSYGFRRGSRRARSNLSWMKKRHLDAHLLLLVTFALVAFGLVMVYSATSASAAIGGHDPSFYLKRQGVYAALGLALL